MSSLAKVVRALPVVLKSSALLTCLLMGLDGYPPVHAQQPSQAWREEGPAESATDRVQDKQIEELNQHLAHTDGIIDGADRRVRDIEMDMSEMRGEARAAFLLLGLLTSGSLVLQVRLRRNAEKGGS